MLEIQTTITPHSQQPYVRRTYPTQDELDGIINRAVEAQKNWAQVPLAERIAVGRKFIVRVIGLDFVSLMPMDYVGRVQSDER